MHISRYVCFRAARGMVRRVLDLICLWQGEGQCSEKIPNQPLPCRAAALFIALTHQKGKRSFLTSCFVCLSPLIVFFGAFYFLYVLISRLKGEQRLSPQLLWQPLFASQKVHLKGTTKCETICFGIVLHLANVEKSGCMKTQKKSAGFFVAAKKGGGFSAFVFNYSVIFKHVSLRLLFPYLISVMHLVT